MTNTLVIDTSYGSAVGVVGREPIIETDSRTHVERLQANIAKACGDAGLEPADIDRIVVGIGPAPFTGLRAGIVTAKALAYATGAQLLGQDILSAQVGLSWLRPAVGGEAGHDDSRPEDSGIRHITLAVNDARRRQLYFALIGGDAVSVGEGFAPACSRTLIPMDIDYPTHIVERINAYADQLPGETIRPFVIDVVGHGAAKYADTWGALLMLGTVTDASVIEHGTQGLRRFADLAARQLNGGRDPEPVEPLYLRRPDVSVPNPMKHVLNDAHGAQR